MFKKMCLAIVVFLVCVGVSLAAPVQKSDKCPKAKAEAAKVVKPQAEKDKPHQAKPHQARTHWEWGRYTEYQGNYKFKATWKCHRHHRHHAKGFWGHHRHRHHHKHHSKAIKICLWKISSDNNK